MLYLNDSHIEILQPSISESIQLIEEASKVIAEKDFAQPIKPYLRYGNPKNRIIAMPAFVGGKFNVSGIKWISSFPENIDKNLPRAHAVIILNNADNGKPVAIINSGSISAIRTSAVSSAIINRFIKFTKKRSFLVGMTGFGPIGRAHSKMIRELMGDKIADFRVYDPKLTGQTDGIHSFTNSWQNAYKDADIFLTCTVSDKRYIDSEPKNGSLHLNVSLRDYVPHLLMLCKHLAVDDWDEVCREDTDLFCASNLYGLQKSQTISIVDILVENYLDKVDLSKFIKHEYLMFNPMGMATFDLAIAHYCYLTAIEKNIGLQC